MAGCVETQNDLSAYLDGELSAGERGALEAHLRGCAACQAALGELKSVAVSVATLPKVKAPANFAAKLSQQLRKEAAPAANKVIPISSARPQRRSWLMPGVVSAAALVAVAVLVFAVLPGLQKTPPATGVAMNGAPEARKALAPLPAEAQEQLSKQNLEARRKSEEQGRPNELADREELKERAGAPVNDGRAADARSRQEKWVAEPMLQDKAKSATRAGTNAVKSKDSGDKDKARQQNGIQNQFGAPPAPAKPAEASAQPFADADDKNEKRALNFKDENAAKGAGDRVGGGAQLGAAPPMPPAAPKDGEALRRHNKDEKPGQVAAGDPAKPSTIGGGGAGEGGAGRAPGKPAVAAAAPKPEANSKADDDGAAPAKKSANRGPGEVPETALRKLTDGERKTAAVEKSPGAAAPAAAAPATPAPLARGTAKFRADEPVRLTLKSAEPALLAARLRKAATAAGATVVAAPQEPNKALADRPNDDAAQDKGGAKQIIITLTAPAHQREALLKQLQAVHGTVSQADRQADRKKAPQGEAAEADKETAPKQLQGESKAKESAAKKDAVSTGKADAPAVGEEHADKLSKNEEAAGEDKKIALLKSVEETIQIIIVVEPE